MGGELMRRWIPEVEGDWEICVSGVGVLGDLCEGLAFTETGSYWRTEEVGWVRL